jgi:hypothetical protein
MWMNNYYRKRGFYFIYFFIVKKKYDILAQALAQRVSLNDKNFRQ